MHSIEDIAAITSMLNHLNSAVCIARVISTLLPRAKQHELKSDTVNGFEISYMIKMAK